MGFYTGRSGSLVYKGKKVAKIRDWSISTSLALLSTNSIDSYADTHTPGVRTSTGSATLIYYRLETGENATFVQFTDLLKTLMHTGAATEADRVMLQLNVGGTTADDIRVNAYLTSAEVASRTAELSVVPVQFTVDGDFLDTII
jgi:hypothetical protein